MMTNIEQTRQEVIDTLKLSKDFFNEPITMNPRFLTIDAKISYIIYDQYTQRVYAFNYNEKGLAIDICKLLNELHEPFETEDVSNE